MTKYRKRIGILIAAAVALAFSAQAGIKKVKEGKYTWTLSVSGSTAMIGNGSETECATSPKPSGAFKIPAKIGKYSIKGISANAFAGCQSMTSVTIPKGVKRIWGSAFAGCGSLKKATLPSGLLGIESSAFANCISLSAITFPSSVTTIGDYSFSGCTSLASVSIPKGVAVIGLCAFYQCSALAKAVLADGVTDIEANAFRNCTELADLTLPTTLKTIGYGAFYSCKKLQKVRFAATLENIDFEAFYDTALNSYDYLKDGLDASVDSWLKHSLPAVTVANLDKRLLLKLTLKPNNKKYGTVSGGGWHEAGKDVTIRAKAKSGYVFSAWCIDKKCTQAVSEDPDVVFVPNRASPTFQMPRVNKTLYARFVTKAADKKALKFAPATKKLAKTATVGTVDREFGKLYILNYAKSACTYSAKGLPKGLTIDSAGVISGTPRQPGKYTVTVTVKSAGGYKIKQKVLINIAAPDFFNGTYYGYARMTTKASDPPAEVKLSLDKWGYATGKFTWKGKTYSTTSKCTSASDVQAEFPLSVKVGKTTYKFGQVFVSRNCLEDGLQMIAARATDSLNLFTMKPANPGLISSKLTEGQPSPFKDLVGVSTTLSDENDQSGLTKGKINLNILFKDGDVAYITGKINGKKISAVSKQMILKGTTGTLRDRVYELSTGIIDWPNKYYRELRVRLACNIVTGYKPESSTIVLLAPDSLPTSGLGDLD